MTITHAMPSQKQCQAILTKRFKNPTKFKMNRSPIIILTVIILALLPYSSTLNLPSGDPAPGRSPGPPTYKEIDKEESNREIETNLEVSDDTYDEVTTTDEVSSTVSEPSVSERTVGDACSFARIPSDSNGIVTLSERNSDINVTVSHSVFETEELVKGVIYDGECF